MNFNKIMRKANRGIILGIVFIVSVLIITIVDVVRFNSSKSEIEDEINNYLNEYLTASESNYDGIWSDDNINTEIDEVSSVIDKYWTDKKCSGSYVAMCTGKNELKTNVGYVYGKSIYEDEADEDISVVDNVSNTSVSLSNVKIKRAAQSVAIVSCDIVVKETVPAFRNYVGIEGMAYVTDVTAGEASVTYDDSYIGDDKKVNSGLSDIVAKYSDSSFILIYEDGKWKISGMKVYSYGDGSASDYYNQCVYDKETGKKIHESQTNNGANEDKNVKKEGGKDGDRS